MAVKVKVRITEDGLKLKKMMEELGKLEVRVGIQGMESDGQGKYDGEKIYAKAATRDKNGRIVDSEVSLLDIVMFNELGTANIPSRPFIRDSVDANEGKINAFLQSMKKEIMEGKSAEDILKKIGLFQKGLIQEQIVDGDFAQNAEETIRRKGSDTPLVDTGRMRQSINFVIKEKGGSD